MTTQSKRALTLVTPAPAPDDWELLPTIRYIKKDRANAANRNKFTRRIAKWWRKVNN